MHKVTRNYGPSMPRYSPVDARLDSRVTHLSASDNLLIAAHEDGVPVRLPERLKGRVRLSERPLARPYRPLRSRLA